MKQQYLTWSVGALVVLSTAAEADLVCLPATMDGGCALELGYTTKYTERGLVLRDADTDSVVHGTLTGRYTLSDESAIIGGVRVDYFMMKGFDHHDESSPLCDEGTVLLQYASKPTDNTMWALGYQFVHGGLPGYFHSQRHHGGRYVFNSQRPEEHSLVFDLHHDFAKPEGFFWSSRTQYAFRWTEGWFFSNTLGYEHELSENTAAILSLTWTASLRYFDSSHSNSNGTQGWSLSLALPSQISEDWVLEPYVTGVIAGNGADAAGDFYRDSTVVFGFNLSRHF